MEGILKGSSKSIYIFSSFLSTLYWTRLDIFQEDLARKQTSQIGLISNF